VLGDGILEDVKKGDITATQPGRSTLCQMMLQELCETNITRVAREVLVVGAATLPFSSKSISASIFL